MLSLSAFLWFAEQRFIEGNVLFCHLDVIMVFAHIRIAFASQLRDTRQVSDEFCQFFHTAFIGWKDVDDGL